MKKRQRIAVLQHLLDLLLEEADRKTQILGMVAPLCLKPGHEVEDQVRRVLCRIRRTPKDTRQA